MRGDIVKLLESEARRRPIIAELLTRAETLTDEEIDNADVPMKWFKDGLREARKRAKLLAILQYAKDNPSEVEYTSVNLEKGMVLEYVGMPFWANTATNAKIEIVVGDWLFFPVSGGAWLNHVFFENPSAQFANSKTISEHGTRHEYILAYKKKLQMHPDVMLSAALMDEEDGGPKPLVRFYRLP